MNIFTKNNTVLPTGEKNCIQCQLCVKHCPTDSIYINVSFANGMRIAFREMFSTTLQNRYKSKAEKILNDNHIVSLIRQKRK